MVTKKKLIALYLALIHIFVLFLLIKTDFKERFLAKIGFEQLKPEISNYYKTILAFQLRMDGNIPEGSVLFFGDSNTQGLCVSAIIDNAVNLGIGKDTTLGVLKRIPLYNSVEEARAIVLAIGINDIFRRSNKEIIENYKEIISKLPEKTPKFVSAIFPVDGDVKGINGNRRIVEINSELEKLCSSTENCYFFDTGKMLTDTNGNLKYEYHVGDGIHLNSNAYDLWINDLRKNLNRISKSKP